MKPVVVDVLVEQKNSEMAAFVVVPATAVARWKLAGTTTVEGTLDGRSIGRRSLIRWDDARWFLELRRGHLEAIGKSGGDRATLAITVASAELPAELRTLIEADPKARGAWEARTAAQRRMLREEVLAAKSPAARERRARKALRPPEPAPPARVAGLGPSPKPLLIRIVGRRLPGRTCGPYSGIRVGLAQRVGCDPCDGLPADRREVAWETRIEVREVTGAPAFRGPAVNGPPRERFLYLTWTGRKDGGPDAMFRRAKLRLDAVPAGVLAQALRSGVLVGRLDLTAGDGMPVCASVRPPAIEWSAAGE